jgi:hypothetical protein
MFRAVGQIIVLIFLITTGTAGLLWYRSHTAMQRQLEEVKAKNDELKQIVQRLSVEKRVAELLVTNQETIEGKTKTTLLLVEVGRNGINLPPKGFVVEGREVHIDAMVIKFEQHFVEEGDPLRGHSIALFTRIFGDRETPANAQMIDKPGEVPDVYRDADPRISQFEQDLWKDFWKLFDDQKYASSKGVRIANGEGKWFPAQPDRLYTLTIEADGGLNVISGPVPDIYQQAMKSHATAQ